MIRHLLRRVCIVGVEAFALGALAAQADAADWQMIGPTGGSIFSLALDPKTPATIYAGTIGGVFKSLNHGGTWFPLGGFGQAPVFWVAIDPTTPSTIYAGTRNFRLFKSVNGGVSWTQASTNLTGKKIFAIVIDPTATSTLYAATEVGVFKSTDGAMTWQAASGAIGSQPVFTL
ncbi:MAG TPA: hypothetical protein VEG84_00850, partial [Thermoanaerobaculia bacterium]|nr:hypothetical protein [Thermoanaerobaculia bacterium]